MGLRRLTQAAAASALALAAVAAPAMAHDGPHGPPHAPDQPPIYDQGYYSAPDSRQNWLAECRDRLSDSYRAREAEERCATYLNNYYARFDVQRAYGSHAGSAYGHPYGYQGGYAADCCQPAMMRVPAARGEPKCTETVEYEYVDVPVRAAPPPRPVPQKRTKVVPDKRIYVK